MTFRHACIALLVAALASTGCPAPKTGIFPAKGTLTLNGEPASNVSITFLPSDGGGREREAGGRVQNGSFEVYTGVRGIPGAIPGKYKLVLTAHAPTSGPEFDAYVATIQKRSVDEPERHLPFPDKYLAAWSSDKEVEIIAGDNNLVVEITWEPEPVEPEGQAESEEEAGEPASVNDRPDLEGAESEPAVDEPLPDATEVLSPNGPTRTR